MEHRDEDHNRLRMDEERWGELAFVGIQESEVNDIAIELRNCTCGTTLGRRAQKRRTA